MKKCRNCKRKLGGSHFYKDITKKDGLRSYCKECNSNYNKEYHMGCLNAGLCYDCGKPRPKGYIRYCHDCLKKREGLIEIYEQKRKTNGLCRQCGKNPIDYIRSKLHCTSCLDRRNFQAYKKQYHMSKSNNKFRIE